MHYWGEEDFDWEGLDWCVNYLHKNLVRWGRVQVRQTKEKYGTLRCYLSLGWEMFHSITHPGHCFSRYPDWLWKLDCKYGRKIISLLNHIIVPYHKWLYRKLYQDCIKKYPHLRKEILCYADYSELLIGL